MVARRCAKSLTVGERSENRQPSGLMLYHHLPNWPEDRIDASLAVHILPNAVRYGLVVREPFVGVLILR